MNLDREIWEGWTPRDFIKELEPLFVSEMSRGNPSIKTVADVRRWTADNQPYYKKQVPEVVSYFSSALKRIQKQRQQWAA